MERQTDRRMDTHTHTHISSALVSSQPLRRMGAEALWGSSLLPQSPVGTPGASPVPSTIPPLQSTRAPSRAEPACEPAMLRSRARAAPQASSGDVTALQHITPPCTSDHPSAPTRLSPTKVLDALVQSPVSGAWTTAPTFLTPNKPAAVFPHSGHPHNETRAWTCGKTAPGSPLSSGRCIALHHPQEHKPNALPSHPTLEARTRAQHDRPAESES